MISDVIRAILGFDYGRQRIGLATGQTITGTANPLTTLNAVQQAPDWAGIESHIRQWRPDALVVGIPRHLDGSESDMTRAAEKFSRQLEQRFDLPVYRIDESLTSFEAESRLKQEVKLGQHNKHEIDKIAAAIIVQSWLDQFT
jgi:putative Holliday junction resolvase